MIKINYLNNVEYKQNNSNNKNEIEIPDGKYKCILEDIDIKEIPVEWNKLQKHQLILKFSIIENCITYDKSLNGKIFYINHHIPFGIDDPNFDKLIRPLQITCSFVNSNYIKLEDFLNSDLSQNTGGIYQILIEKKNNFIAKYIKAKLEDAPQPKPITPPNPFEEDVKLNYDPFSE